jgi:hypothetical protein
MEIAFFEETFISILVGVKYYTLPMWQSIFEGSIVPVCRGIEIDP